MRIGPLRPAGEQEMRAIAQFKILNSQFSIPPSHHERPQLHLPPPVGKSPPSPRCGIGGQQRTIRRKGHRTIHRIRADDVRDRLNNRSIGQTPKLQGCVSADGRQHASVRRSGIPSTPSAWPIRVRIREPSDVRQSLIALSWLPPEDTMAPSGDKAVDKIR